MEIIDDAIDYIEEGIGGSDERRAEFLDRFESNDRPEWVEELISLCEKRTRNALSDEDWETILERIRNKE